MEEFLARELATGKLKPLGSAGGCVSATQSYETDTGKVFVKSNDDRKAKVMYDGECAGLEALSNTQIVRVPKHMKVLAQPNGQGWLLVMEHLELRPLDKYQATFGEQLARLHLHNLQRREAAAHLGESSGCVDKFGFHCPTCCGFIPLRNEWTQDWIEFYINSRLKPQVDRLVEKYNDGELKRLWSQLEAHIPSFFDGVEVRPSLLHGDLWFGNVLENDDGPVTFDPAVFYGHHEFDLAIAGMFGGFNQQFYSAYHSLIPKAPGFEKRHKLYLLFHYFNHWDHFGAGYQSKSLALLTELCP